ncbi:MAG: hypothetical protein WB626_09145 [Bacteroidota bacterium]
MHRMLLALGLAAMLAAGGPSLHAQKTAKPKQASVQHAPATLKDVLREHVGAETSIGKILRVEGDFFEVESDGVRCLHAIAAVHTIRYARDDETGEERIEIVLLAGD